LDPANTCCVKLGETTAINLVTEGLITGANGAPGSGTHTPLPANFPKISFVSGIEGAVFNFAGGKGMNCDEDLGTRTTTTISMWLYKNSSETQYISDARNGGGQWFISNYLSYNLNYTEQMRYNFDVSYNASSPSFLNQWVHMTVTSNATESKIYINGVEETATTSNSIDEDLGPNFRIGCPLSGISATWTGYMGPIHIYDTVLSDTEILQNFNSHKTRYGL
jgi:hypothetical protein